MLNHYWGRALLGALFCCSLNYFYKNSCNFKNLLYFCNLKRSIPYVFINLLTLCTVDLKIQRFAIQCRRVILSAITVLTNSYKEPRIISVAFFLNQTQLKPTAFLCLCISSQRQYDNNLIQIKTPL